MATEQNTNNWPELAIGLYDKLTGRDAEISTLSTILSSLCQVQPRMMLLMRVGR